MAIVVVHEDDEHALALIGEAVEFASGPGDRAAARRRHGLPLARRRARHRRVRRVGRPGVGAGRDRGRHPALPRGRAAAREGGPARGRARAARRDRAREGHSHGAPRRARARGVRAAARPCARRRAAASSRSPSPCSTATRCCPSGRDLPRIDGGRRWERLAHDRNHHRRPRCGRSCTHCASRSAFPRSWRSSRRSWCCWRASRPAVTAWAAASAVEAGSDAEFRRRAGGRIRRPPGTGPRGRRLQARVPALPEGRDDRSARPR